MNDLSTAKPYPWLKYYPEGVPADIDPDAYTSLVELIDEGCQQFADRPAYANMGKQLTFREIYTLSGHFASYLQNDLKLQKGDRVVIQMPNLLQYPVALFGILRAGLVVVNTNPLYTPREMQHQFKDSGAKAIVILANFAANLEKIIDQTDIKHIIITQIGDLLGFPKKQVVNAVVKYVKKMVPAYHLSQTVSLSEAISRGSRHALQKVPLTGSDLAFVQYTGGTTGVSKGAALTHRNIVANTLAGSYWMQIDRINAPQCIMITPLPLYHIYALTVNAFLALKNGCLSVLITNPRDMNAFIDDLKKYKFHMFVALNTLYNGLLNNPRIKEVDFSHLQVASAGGMALQTSVAERWKQLTGITIAEGYGLSETSPILSSNSVDGRARLGTIGLPLPSTEMKIMQEDGTEAPMGMPGEIWAKGPQVFSGYYNRPEETAQVLEDGWFKTGDIGVMDEDGFFRIVDRKKDMILVSGFNVYPNEIEDVIAKCPGVLEVACIGVPDEKSTETVKVFVVKKDPNLTAEDILKYSKEQLTNYKRPRHIEFREELPKSNVGKILRRPLRDEELAKLKKK
ncbi:AMP-binding protein [Larkinella insperata]|uniref:Long-chain-fatty-acid--CoA ligase n=1 Tax=Larkinella insperata TaxID=332158 RepID=A0ABW3Q6F7_9BACT|nr:AMP-binding protein [Larkinella insperata]